VDAVLSEVGLFCTCEGFGLAGRRARVAGNFPLFFPLFSPFFFFFVRGVVMPPRRGGRRTSNTARFLFFLLY